MTTTEAKNKELVRRFRNDIYEEGKLERIDEYIAEDCVSHSPLVPEDGHGPEDYRAFIAGLLAAFPDYDDAIEDLIAEDDKVAVRIRMTGTHEGAFMDLDPTGKAVDVSGMIIYRIEGGQIVEDWHQADMMGMLQQLGVAPGP